MGEAVKPSKPSERMVGISPEALYEPSTIESAAERRLNEYKLVPECSLQEANKSVNFTRGWQICRS
jgi:hypothetical protein